jgi:hypothetical protein
MNSNIIDFLSSRMSSYADEKERRMDKLAEGLSHECLRLEPIAIHAQALAERFSAGEFSKSYAMEVAQFLDVPTDKLEELFLLLDAFDERR